MGPGSSHLHLIQGPLHVLSHQGVGVQQARLQRRGSQAKLAAAEPLFLIAAERSHHPEPA